MIQLREVGENRKTENAVFGARISLGATETGAIQNVPELYTMTKETRRVTSKFHSSAKKYFSFNTEHV